MTDATLPLRPSPRSEVELERHWAATAEGHLAIGRCRDCLRQYFPAQLACPQCWSSNTYVEHASGYGTVEAVSVVHRHNVPAFKARLPYAIVFVRLDEGIALTSTVVGVPTEDVEIGLRVQVAFENSVDGTAIPVFTVEEK
ncbi:Zn-ribbon domain-containing OB-fold protein [Streptomyces sp. WG-D5]